MTEDAVDDRTPGRQLCRRPRSDAAGGRAARHNERLGEERLGGDPRHCLEARWAPRSC